MIVHVGDGDGNGRCIDGTMVRCGVETTDCGIAVVRASETRQPKRWLVGYGAASGFDADRQLLPSTSPESPLSPSTPRELVVLRSPETATRPVISRGCIGLRAQREFRPCLALFLVHSGARQSETATRVISNLLQDITFCRSLPQSHDSTSTELHPLIHTHRLPVPLRHLAPNQRTDSWSTATSLTTCEERSR